MALSFRVNDAEYYETLYSNDRNAEKWEWGAKQFAIPHSILSTADRKLHRMRRGVLNEAFSMQRAGCFSPWYRRE